MLLLLLLLLLLWPLRKFDNIKTIIKKTNHWFKTSEFNSVLTHDWKYIYKVFTLAPQIDSSSSTSG